MSKQHAVETYGGLLRPTSTLYRPFVGGDEEVKFVLFIRYSYESVSDNAVEEVVCWTDFGMAENIHMSALQNEVLCLVVIGGDGGSGGVE